MSAASTAEALALPLVDSDEIRLLRESVARICGSERFGHAYSVAKTEADKPPVELWDELASHGYLGVNIPEEYGGGGLGLSGLAVVGEEIAAAGCSLLLIVVSPAIVGSIIAKHALPEQRDRWLPGIADGTFKCAFAITEPGAGSNSHKLSTAALKDGDRYILRGEKTYISAVEHADAIMVVARERLPDGNLGLPLPLIVDVDSPGLERSNIPTALRAPDKQWTLHFDDVEVPRDRLVGSEDGGLGALFDGLNPERIMGAATGVGAGRRALELAAAYARDRKVWGGPIGAHQGISHPLAQAKIELEQAKLMMQKAAALYDAGAPAAEESNMAKYAAGEAAIRCVDQAIQTHGGNGFAVEYGLSDMWFGVRLLRTAPVSREMILNYVAEHSLGLPRSY